jgi:hypothetical protein
MLNMMYVSLHSVLLFIEVVTMNVAINSESNALLTLLISNNFIELKASVLKRFKHENLFQVACSDIVERFHIIIILCCVGAQNSSSLAALQAFGWAALCIGGSEFVVDWIKHGFITKFNRISATAYSKFLAILCSDVSSSNTTARHAMPLDAHQAVAWRLGLSVMPLACVLLRFTLVSSRWAQQAHWSWVVCIIVALFGLKLIVSALLLHMAQPKAMEFRRKVLNEPSRRLMDSLNSVRRYSLCASRIPH